MYDVCSRQSFSRLDAWFDELETYATNTNIVKMLIGNKIDKVTPFFVIRFRENMISHCDIYRNEEKWAGKKDSNLLKSIQCYSLKPAQKLKMESKWLLKNLSRRWFYIFFSQRSFAVPTNMNILYFPGNSDTWFVGSRCGLTKRYVPLGQNWRWPVLVLFGLLQFDMKRETCIRLSYCVNFVGFDLRKSTHLLRLLSNNGPT